jgi:hypothetical protein
MGACELLVVRVPPCLRRMSVLHRRSEFEAVPSLVHVTVGGGKQASRRQHEGETGSGAGAAVKAAQLLSNKQSAAHEMIHADLPPSLADDERRRYRGGRYQPPGSGINTHAPPPSRLQHLSIAVA